MRQYNQLPEIAITSEPNEHAKPGLQRGHSSTWCVEFEYLPEGQVEHVSAPKREYLPAGHGTGGLSHSVQSCPMGQLAHFIRSDSPAGKYFPLGHRLH